ncbi:hypothetical protein DFH09DRAFT_1072270 [Mycena vulgaris]|nr:hypothetical protein DFH09DRAFT_1072270 [Mycena vulgaris]
MNFLAALLASLLAVAAANPVGDMAAREPAGPPCEIVPSLSCQGGIDQQIACGDAWTCSGNGLHPVISNATCAAQSFVQILGSAPNWFNITIYGDSTPCSLPLISSLGYNGDTRGGPPHSTPQCFTVLEILVHGREAVCAPQTSSGAVCTSSLEVS